MSLETGKIVIQTFNNYGTVHFHSQSNEVKELVSKKEEAKVIVETPEVKVPVVTSPVVQTEGSDEKHMFARFTLQEKHISKLYEWTNMKSFKIIYSIENDAFDAKTFFSKVNGKKNVMLLMEAQCNNSVFGAFFSQMPTKQEVWVTEDTHHFVFTLRNPMLVPPTMILPRPANKNIIMIKADNNTREIWENRAFDINNDTTSHADPRYTGMYFDQLYKGEKVFVGNQTSFKLNNFVALEWN